MKTPAEFFQEHRVDFLEAGQHHHAGQGWIQLRHCPACGSDNYHLGVSLRTLSFHCWSCGPVPAGRVFSALHLPRPSIREFFGQVQREAPPAPRLQGKLIEPWHRGPLLRPHRDYLRSRKFDPDRLQKLWELEGIAQAAWLSWRLYIPITLQGIRISWTTRAVGDQSRRYVSASEAEEAFPHKHCLYGEDLAGPAIVAVEGPTDVWRIGPGAVGLFGTAYTPEQVRRLALHPIRYLLFDNEPIAQQQARKLAAQLACFPGRTVVLECSAQDPGSLSPRDVQRLRKLLRQ